MGLRVVVCDRRHGRIDAVGGLRQRVGWGGAQFGADAIEEGFPGGPSRMCSTASNPTCAAGTRS